MYVVTVYDTIVEQTLDQEETKLMQALIVQGLFCVCIRNKDWKLISYFKASGGYENEIVNIHYQWEKSQMNRLRPVKTWNYARDNYLLHIVQWYYLSVWSIYICIKYIYV